MTTKTISKYLPLSEATYYIMLALAKPMHGYGIMQTIGEISEGAVRIGPGTLYGAISTLEKEKLIEKVREENRRKVYQLTSKGRAVLSAQLDRLLQMAKLGRNALRNE